MSAGESVGMIFGVIFALLAALLAGISHILIRVGTQHDGKSAEVLVIVLMMNIIVFVPMAITDLPAYEFSWRTFLAFAGGGLAGTILGRSFSYEGIKRIGASRSQTIVASQPLHSALIAAVVLGESVTFGHLLGILAIMSGVVTISKELRNSQASNAINTSRMSLLFPLAAAFFYGIEPIFAKIGLIEATPVYVGLAIKTTTAAIVLFCYLWLRGQLPSFASLNGPNLWWYVGAGVFNTMFLLAYFRALEISPVVLVVPIVQILPLIVIGLSFLFLKRLEVITWKLVLAAMSVVVGAAIVTWAS